MTERSFGSLLRQIGLALLNATLLLAVLLVFGLWLLIGRVQHFATDTAEAAATAIGADLTGDLQGQVAGIGAAIETLSTLDERLTKAIADAGATDTPAVAELTALRTDVQALTAAVDQLNTTATALRGETGAALAGSLQQILLELAGKIGPLPAPTPPAN